MASVSYEKIFELFLGNITDFKLASLEKDDAQSLMTEYLHKALAASYLSHIFSTSVLDDDTETFTYSMAYETDNDETDFVCTAISKWMTYEWLQNQVKNSTLTQQMIFSSKEKTFYSQANHLAELRALKDDAYKEARGFVQDRGWIHNSYLGGS